MDAVKNFIRAITPLALLGTTLTAISSVLSGPLSVGLVTKSQVYSALIIVAFFLVITGLSLLAQSVRTVKTFVDNSVNRVDIVALWRSMAILSPMLAGSAVVALIALSLDGNASLAEIYRTRTVVWHDEVLWNIEAPLFRAIASSDFVSLQYWETIYHMMWIYVLVVMATLVRRGHTESYMTLASAIVLSFYCAAVIALVFPVAGPHYHRPELFGYLEGSSTQLFQDVLGNYQAGKIQQNGLYYGTKAMPSLHVALTAMSTWFVARHMPSALWLAIAWLALIWMSTVVLGWHYAFDGVAAIVMSAVCILCGRTWVRFFRPLTKPPCHLTPSDQTAGSPA
jgi:membrane-associated phospholipid phosphatase